jgi:hypothetical protein
MKTYNSNHKKVILTAAIFIIISSVARTQSTSLVNTSHLDALYEEIKIDGNNLGIIHIYSDYPDYNWVGDDDEGMTCVDDVSRAAVFYINNYTVKGDTLSLIKSERLIRFLLHMQSDNGFFYNFMFDDYSINKTHKNSVAEPNWWTWRAMVALSHSYKILKEINSDLAADVKSSLQNSVEAAIKSFPHNSVIQIINKIEFPSWLPAETASDQASELVLALLNYYSDNNDLNVLKLLNNLCEGILLMQRGTDTNVPYCAFLSWQNNWHAYGNIQSYALLRASQVLKRDDLKEAALKEINFFYPYILKEGYLSSFTINRMEGTLVFSEISRFSQIAYNFRPVIYAYLEAFNLTKDSSYINRALDFSQWFFGHNVAEKQMYDPSTGRCFDGIDSDGKVNLNSGAESTIEALLSMQMLEQYEIASNKLNNKE